MKITNPRRIVHTIALAGGLVGMSATVARAQGEDRFWTGDADQFNSVGMFAEALNWDLDLVSAAPGPDDTAIFDLGNTTIAMFDGAMENNRLLVDGGAVDFELGGFVYTLNNPLEITPSLAIGSETGAVGHLWVGDGVLAAQYADVGAAPGSFGDLTLGAGAALDCAQHLRVGNQGAGLLTIEDGAVATSSRTLIGQTGGAFGDGLISGPGARLDTFGSLIVGGGGMGRLRVDNGAVATADDAIVAQLLNSTGDVVVSGVGSQWTVGGSLDIGFHGFGSLTIEAGAQVTNEVFATLGTMPDIDFSVGDRFEGGRGTVVIAGAGSQWTVNGDLWVGLTRFGFLTLSAGGALEVSGDLFRGEERADLGTQLTIQLASSDDYLTPAIDVGLNIDDFFAGTGLAPHIELIDGFVPQRGDSFFIASASVILQPMTYVLPALPAELFWVVRDGATTSKLLVGPLDGDVDADGAVDIVDFLAILAAWGACPGCPEDFNEDALVDIEDFLAVLANWG